jgi:hypothetical protein
MPEPIADLLAIVILATYDPRWAPLLASSKTERR